MSVQVLTDVIVPTGLIAMGVSGRSVRRNVRTENQAGIMQITQGWLQTRREYTFGIQPLEAPGWQMIEALYEVTEGGAYGMLLEDPKDSQVSASQGLLHATLAGQLVGTIGHGYGVPSYRLHKRYSAHGTARTFDRLITRPKSPATVMRNGSPVAVGAGAGNISINYDTGTVTFAADLSQGIQSITIGASTVLNFVNGVGIVAALDVGQRVYITGVSGTAGAVLNGRAHDITAKGATSLTISTSTAGLSGGGGTAAKYPQASDVLTWSGGFFVPVHFRDDAIDWTFLVGHEHEDGRVIAGPSVVLQEIKER